MTASRDELIHLIEGMPDDQVDALLADARRAGFGTTEGHLAAQVRRHDEGRSQGRLIASLHRRDPVARLRQRALIVCDTGPLVALSNERDEHYFTANNLFRDLHMAGETLALPATVLVETCYWLN